MIEAFHVKAMLTVLSFQEDVGVELVYSLIMTENVSLPLERGEKDPLQRTQI